jgi:hypothetical protein
MADAKKCPHPSCTCTLEKGQHFCSARCEAAKGTTELLCESLKIERQEEPGVFSLSPPPVTWERLKAAGAVTVCRRVFDAPAGLYRSTRIYRVPHFRCLNGLCQRAEKESQLVARC